jgi:hypothetical protein
LPIPFELGSAIYCGCSCHVKQPDKRGTYDIKLWLICDEPEIAEKYDRELLQLFGGQVLAIDDIEFSFEVNSLDEVRLSELNGWQRFTEWDYLSGMDEAISTPGS